jgi:hypothetical protein
MSSLANLETASAMACSISLKCVMGVGSIAERS